MKICNFELLALFLFHPNVWGASAFVVQAPKALIKPSVALHASNEVSGAADVKSIWDTSTPVIMQAGNLRTWPIGNPDIEKVLVSMKTEGRPLNANVELWHGPDYTPWKMKVYIEDGDLRPFNAVVSTPLNSNTLALRNTGHMEFPFAACVEGIAENGDSGFADAPNKLYEASNPKLVQGGSITSFPFDPAVESVQVLMTTDGRNLKARIELMQGPNNDKQVLECYSSDGKKRPFFAIIETPGSGNVVRIVNENTVEFPFHACVAPYVIGDGGDGLTISPS